MIVEGYEGYDSYDCYAGYESFEGWIKELCKKLKNNKGIKDFLKNYKIKDLNN